MNIVAIDAGGSNTRFELFNLSGKSLFSIILGSCHIAQYSKEYSISLLQKGVKTVNNSNNFIISAGLAGYGSPKNKKLWDDIFQSAFPSTPYYLTNDAKTALIGAHSGRDGLLLICGTGSIALKQQNKQFSRTGGWGYHFGDEGSGYWIGRNILQVFSQQADNRLAKTQLYEQIMHELNLTNHYDILQISGDLLSRDNIAKLTPLAIELAEDGDIFAINIIDEAVKQLNQMVQALDAAPNKLPIVLHGGIWKNQYFKHRFESLLDPEIKIIEPANSASYGAFLLAKEKYGHEHSIPYPTNKG